MTAVYAKANVELVREIYEAVARGDVVALLARMAETARWEFNVSASDVPWHAPAFGHRQIEGLLSKFVDQVMITKFEPLTFIASDDNVAEHVRLIYTVKKNGRVADEDQLNWWSLHDGLVTRLRHFEDTGQVISAWQNAAG
jgi:ketosteroid isomerase-like protein